MGGMHTTVDIHHMVHCMLWAHKRRTQKTAVRIQVSSNNSYTSGGAQDHEQKCDMGSKEASENAVPQQGGNSGAATPATTSAQADNNAQRIVAMAALVFVIFVVFGILISKR